MILLIGFWLSGIGIAIIAASLIEQPLQHAAIQQLTFYGLAIAVIGFMVTCYQAIKLRRLWLSAAEQAKLKELEREHLLEELHLQGRLEHELLLAKQSAEDAALAKGAFLATMSHEIRTPLNGIIPMLELIGRGQLAPDQRQMLQTANESSMQLLRILNDILDYSKLEVDKLELETTLFNLRDVLQGVTRLMQRAADAKKLTLHLHIDSYVRLPVCGDPVRLRQILTNLIGNAIKFTERGRIDVYLKRLGERGNKHHVRFEVHDTGIGIPREQQERLFSAFSQADASTTRLYGGTGLGLAICKRIIGLMGGRIGVQSQKNVGSTFWFELPLLKIPGDLPDANGKIVTQRMLLVSSDEQLSQRLRQRLVSHDFYVDIVETTQEAIDLLRQSQRLADRYDVVIGDHTTLRYSARALQRAVLRGFDEIPSPQMIWLQGDEPMAEELQNDSEQIPRQNSDDLLVANMTLLTPANPVVDDDLTAPTTQTEIPSFANNKTRILLVEDNPVNLAVAQKILSTLGFKAESAENGQIAISRMKQESYDLVLMDCQMPVLDGYTATQRWREYERQQRRRPLPIIAMTANAMADDRQHCIEAGMNDYVSKPIARDQLASCLRIWLSPEPKQSPLSILSNVSSSFAPSPTTEQTTMPTEDPSSETLPVLDQDLLDELSAIAGKETVRILELFLEDAPQSVERMQAAIAAKNAHELREAAHTLKSSSANVGAKSLSAVAKLVEIVARNGDTSSAQTSVRLAVAEYDRVKQAIRQQIQRMQRQS